MIEIIRNPIIIGLTVGVLVYLYLRWEQSERPEEKNKRKDTNLLIPLGIGTACWFIANNYFENYNFNNDNSIPNNPYQIEDITANLPQKLELTDNGAMMGGGLNTNNLSFGINNGISNSGFNNNMSNLNYKPPVNSYHLLKKGITIPNNMPDVLLENF